MTSNLWQHVNVTKWLVTRGKATRVAIDKWQSDNVMKWRNDKSRGDKWQVIKRQTASDKGHVTKWQVMERWSGVVNGKWESDTWQSRQQPSYWWQVTRRQVMGDTWQNHKFWMTTWHDIVASDRVTKWRGMSDKQSFEQRCLILHRLPDRIVSHPSWVRGSSCLDVTETLQNPCLGMRSPYSQKAVRPVVSRSTLLESWFPSLSDFPSTLWMRLSPKIRGIFCKPTFS